jgi:hypothetical protein
MAAIIEDTRSFEDAAAGPTLAEQGAEKGFLPLLDSRGSEKRALIPKGSLSRARQRAVTKSHFSAPLEACATILPFPNSPRM